MALAAALSLAYAAWQTFPKESGTVRVAGAAAGIAIETDARGVPTIRARSIPDAVFGLGYAHARDRLWQMEFERRVGSGRLAEILGESLVPADRFLRTVGFRRAAESAWRSLSPEARGLLEAYARGVNAYLATSSRRPIEFRLLRVDPEPWQPVDSLVWAKMMAWDLAGNARDEIRRARFAALVGPERAAELLPAAASEPTILTREEWSPAAAPSSSSALSTIPLTRPGSLEDSRVGVRLAGSAGLRRRGPGQQLVGRLRRPHGEREADSGQRPAPGSADAVGLVPRGDRGSRLRGRAARRCPESPA